MGKGIGAGYFGGGEMEIKVISLGARGSRGENSAKFVFSVGTKRRMHAGNTYAEPRRAIG